MTVKCLVLEPAVFRLQRQGRRRLGAGAAAVQVSVWPHLDDNDDSRPGWYSRVKDKMLSGDSLRVT